VQSTPFKTHIYDCPCTDDRTWAIVIPIKSAKEFGWEDWDKLEIQSTPEGVLIRKIN
jgi:hypothetical protein